MARKLKSDTLLFLITLFLLGGSVVMVYSASAVLAEHKYQQASYFLYKQLTWIVVGLVLLAVAVRIDYRNYRQPIVIGTALVIVTLALVAVLFSEPVNGARRWFNWFGIGVQPSEPAKLAVILFMAAVLERRMDRIQEPLRAMLPVVLVVGLIAVLILAEPDFGTAASLVIVVGVMAFAAGLPYRHLAGLTAGALVIAIYAIATSPYRLRRFWAFLDPWRDPLGDGFHIIQSLIAVGTGGLFGRGLMGGVQKLFFLPEPHTDFIFAVIAEEMGLVGASAVVLCFGLIAWRGLRIAARASDRFGAFLAVGVTAMVAVQAYLNMSVAVKLLPTKGIPLPFVSAGGSSLLVSLVGIGILLNVSQHEVQDT
jgi:cell division protein FtsW